MGNIADRDFEESDISPENLEKLRKMRLPFLSENLKEKSRAGNFAGKEEGNSLGGIVNWQ